MARDGEMPRLRPRRDGGEPAGPCCVGGGAILPPFGAPSSDTIDSAPYAASYQGVKVPDHLALGLALVARSLARGRR